MKAPAWAGFKWWGVKLPGKSADFDYTSKLDHILLLPTGRYDVYWWTHDQQNPVPLARNVEVKAAEIAEVEMRSGGMRMKAPSSSSTSPAARCTSPA